MKVNNLATFNSRNNFAKIDIYFEEMSFAIVQQEPAYSGVALLSKCNVRAKFDVWSELPVGRPHCIGIKI